MPCFLIESTFKRPFESFGDAVAEHRAHLKKGYDEGWLLVSGPKLDKSGGIMVARVDSVATIEAFFDADPYRHRGLAEYRVTGFDAVLSDPLIAGWLATSS
ncbi:MAG: YciI family protein [Gaiellaceae bacterium]